MHIHIEFKFLMCRVIRLQRIYNFRCSMLILCQLLHVFTRFPTFSGLTYWQDATVSVPCFLLFLVSKKLFWKYSRNWTPRRQKSLFFQQVPGVRRGVEDGHHLFRSSMFVSSSFVPTCLDLVSCLTWSRSSLCNATCCVCWDLMNIEYYAKLIRSIIHILFVILHALRC